MPGPLDRLDELPLMLRAGPGNALGDNLPLLGNEAAESLLILVINVDFLTVTETACAPFFELLILFCHVYP